MALSASIEPWRSVFISFESMEAATTAIAKLHADASLVKHQVNGIFDPEFMKAPVYEVFFSIAAGDLLEDGYEGEAQFRAAAEALGGEYTGS